MQAGVFWGYVDLIDGLCERVIAEFGQPMKVIATGGVASLFKGASRMIEIFDPDLNTRGLLEIYRRNGGAF
jgi:type III pantothenate kinase